MSSLIEENPASAQNSLRHFQKCTAMFWNKKNKELVPLAEELAFATTYMELLIMRFENSISFELPKTRMKIPK